MLTRGQPPWVAVVDDELALRESIAGLLRSAGLPTTGFASAEDFLDANTSGLGCLVLDIRLPGMSGLELQQHLRRMGRRLPVVFVTAEADADGRLCEQACRCGAAAFLHKPFLGDDLLAQVHHALALQGSAHGST